jgi:non-specific serine/threonine protein kinase
VDDRCCAAAALGVLGSGQAARGAFARAIPLLEESLREALPLRDPWGRFALHHARLVLGISALGEGDTESACRLLEESRTGFETLGDLRFMSVANTWLGHAALRRGDPARAAALLAAAMEGHQAVGDRVYFLVYTLLHFAEVLSVLDLPALATRLLGAGEALRESLGAPLPIPRAARHQALVAALRANLPVATFESGWAAGRALTLAETMAEAIGAARQLLPLDHAVVDALTAGSADGPLLEEPALHPSRRTATAAFAGPRGALTPREREVVRLIGRGYSNRQIADRLVIAVGTAGVHVEHILRKLDLQSRHQVADWAKAHGLLAE